MRYFIVMYYGRRRFESSSVHSRSFVTDGKYISMSKLKVELESEGLHEVCVTNIIELTESDFNDWNKTN